MAVLINMAMPTRCGLCRFATAMDCMANMEFIKNHNERAEHCPLKQLRQNTIVRAQYVKNSDDWHKVKCSNCGITHDVFDTEKWIKDHKYCYNCGAKMDLKQGIK